MEKWTTGKMSDLIEFNPKERISKGENAKKIAMDKLKPFERDIEGYEIAQFKGGSKFRNGDTLLARITPCLENGKTAQVNVLEDNEVGFGSTEFIVLRAKPGVSDKDYIYYLAISPLVREQAIQSMVGSSGRQRVQQGVLNDLDICIHPLSEQIEIGRTLKVLDDKIAINTKINHHLEQMAQAIFRYWFIERMSQSYDYQSDLIFRSLFDFANYINGTSFKKDEYSDTGIPIIKIAELKNGITNSTQRFSGEKDEKYYIKNKDILFSWSGNPETSIDIFLWASGEAILNQHTFIVKTNDGTPWFVYHLLKHFKKEFSHIASNKQTTGLGHVTVSDLRRLQFPYDLELMKAFEQIVSPIMETYYRNLCENQQLAFLRDSLLPKLMSGELSVSDIQAAK